MSLDSLLLDDKLSLPCLEKGEVSCRTRYDSGRGELVRVSSV